MTARSGLGSAWLSNWAPRVVLPMPVGPDSNVTVPRSIPPKRYKQAFRAVTGDQTMYAERGLARPGATSDQVGPPWNQAFVKYLVETGDPGEQA